MDSQDKELSISLVSDRIMRKLNRQYRGIDSPTDVLAFAMLEGEFANINNYLLGDIVISTETALRQAQECGKTLEEEILVLMIHGILHLKGYNHEESPREKKRMKKQEAEFLDILRAGMKE